MAFFPQPCPFYDERHGTIEVHPEIETRYTFNAINDRRYLTQVTVTCMLTAECNCCTFSEIADSESKGLIFDLANYTFPSNVKLDLSETSKSGKRKQRSRHAR